MSLVVGTRRIMPFGDSITAGVTNYTGATGDLPAVPNRVGYRKTLYDGLSADGYAVDFVGSESAGSAAAPSIPTSRVTPGLTPSRSQTTLRVTSMPTRRM